MPGSGVPPFLFRIGVQAMTGHRVMSRWLAGAAVVGAAAFSATPAQAAFSVSGSGAVASTALTMPVGLAPGVAVRGSDLTVTWPPASFGDGAAVPGYVVERLDANGQPAAVGSSCNGVVAAPGCTESNVPNGTWMYVDIPVAGGWTGAPSPRSAPVTIP